MGDLRCICHHLESREYESRAHVEFCATRDSVYLIIIASTRTINLFCTPQDPWQRIISQGSCLPSILYSLLSRWWHMQRQSPIHLFKFPCAGCTACYVGETNRRLSKRIRGWTFVLGQTYHSHIFKGILLLRCYPCSEEWFWILDSAPSPFQLKLRTLWFVSVSGISYLPLIAVHWQTTIVLLCLVQ